MTAVAAGAESAVEPTTWGAWPARADALATAGFLLLVAFLALRAMMLLDPAGAPSDAQWAFQDFRDAVYYPAVDWLAGGNPYDVDGYRHRQPVGDVFPLYAPTALVIHAPFALLPYRLAQVAWFLTNVGLAVMLAAVSLRLARARAGAVDVLGVAALLLASRPGHWNLLLGQPTLEVVLGVLLAVSMGRSRPLLGGFGLALALVKPTFGLPLAVLMVAGRAYAAVAIGAGISGVIALAVGLGLAQAAGGFGALIASLRDNGARFSASHGVDPVVSPFRVDLPALVARLLGRDPGGGSDLVVGGAVLAVSAIGVRRLERRAGARERDLALALSVLAILVWSYHMTYDLLLLAPVVTLLAADREPMPWKPRRALRWAMLAALVLAVFNYASTETALARLQLGTLSRLVVVSFTPAVLAAVWVVFAALAVGAGSREGRRA